MCVGALTGSWGLWPTSGGFSSGRWSRQLRANSLMKTAPPSLAHAATWKTDDLELTFTLDHTPTPPQEGDSEAALTRVIPVLRTFRTSSLSRGFGDFSIVPKQP